MSEALWCRPDGMVLYTTSQVEFRLRVAKDPGPFIPATQEDVDRIRTYDEDEVPDWTPEEA